MVTGRTSIGRWRQMCVALGLGECASEYARVIRAWSARGRYYHTIAHLTACLEELDSVRHSSERLAEVELALWFHDAVYRTYRRDNESRSAAWAARFIGDHGASHDVAARVYDLVLATTHRALPSRGDAALMVDVDLSILGQCDDIYDAFEWNVRREYWWVPRRRYRVARIRILTSLLSRATIYQCPELQQRYEAAARRNLARAIAALRSG